MAAFRSASFCLICFLICSSEAQKITRAELGQDVILPCKDSNNINIIVVKWIRPDQDPEYVLLYRDGRFDPDNQHPSYQNRVDLQDKEMKDGNFSLILKNVKMEDTGTYECRVDWGRTNRRKRSGPKPISIIYLKVLPSAQEKITAEVGQDVILPCKAPNNNNIIVVQWIRPDQDSEYVLLYRDERLDPDYQHPSYQNRVDLQDKEMKDGDASLFLKNVTMEDRGTYECRVDRGRTNRRKRSGPKLISNITLEVHPPGEKFEGNKIGEDMVGISRRHPGVVGGILPLLAVLASLGFLMYKRHMKKNPNLPVPPDEPAAIEMLPVPEQHQNQVQLV